MDVGALIPVAVSLLGSLFGGSNPAQQTSQQGQQALQQLIGPLLQQIQAKQASNPAAQAQLLNVTSAAQQLLPTWARGPAPTLTPTGGSGGGNTPAAPNLAAAAPNLAAMGGGGSAINSGGSPATMAQSPTSFGSMAGTGQPNNPNDWSWLSALSPALSGKN